MNSANVINADMELVREYVASQSDAAFEAIVTRHVNLVYSAARRQVRDDHLAQEITQAVFILLSKKDEVARAGDNPAELVVSGDGFCGRGCVARRSDGKFTSKRLTCNARRTSNRLKQHGLRCCRCWMI